VDAQCDKLATNDRHQFIAVSPNVERFFRQNVVQFVSTLSKGRNFTKSSSFDVVAKNGNNGEATFDFVERIVRLVAFDNVASTLLLVWTGL